MIGSNTRKDEALDRLTDGIAQLTSSDTWRSWLAMQARFHNYSFANTVLIFGQHPTATRVAGFRTWRRLGRQVQRGQQAIWILAPVVTRRVDDQPDATDLESPTRTVLAFRAIPVFAEDQTSGEPLPEVCRRLSGDDPRGLYEALVQVAHNVGFSVADHAFDSETNGDCSPELRRIRVEQRLAPAHRVKTLVHELAHGLLHGVPVERGLMELEAESVAFVVCHAVGNRERRLDLWLRRQLERRRQRSDRHDQDRRRADPADGGPNPVGTGSGGARSGRPGERRGALSSPVAASNRRERNRSDSAGIGTAILDGGWTPLVEPPILGIGWHDR
jgi:hypothetical protein